MKGALSLADHPGSFVPLACRKCERRGRYRKARLIEKHGAIIALPDLGAIIAADCPRRTKAGNDSCGVYFPALAGETEKKP